MTDIHEYKGDWERCAARLTAQSKQNLRLWKVLRDLVRHDVAMSHRQRVSYCQELENALDMVDLTMAGRVVYPPREVVERDDALQALCGVRE